MRMRTGKIIGLLMIFNICLIISVKIKSDTVVFFCEIQTLNSEFIRIKCLYLSL